ncbi:MAG: hypothetical protein C0631_03195 [Sedimenticola sp.]|jgi:hypothetical protein|nr:MAG: hypothetical protein C0631_03195 [Sedimenticola sp.]
MDSYAVWLLVSAIFLGGLSACSTTQIYSNTQHQKLDLDNGLLTSQGIAFLTPSTITGQEEDKQIIAFVFTETLAEQRPDIPYLSLPQTLSAINDAGLADEYRNILLDYRATGIFDKKTLAKIREATGKRFIAQLKLSDFEQGSRGRFGAFGLRIMDTKQAHVRIFLQIWDGDKGAIVWEATEELSYSHDTTSEKPVTFDKIVSEAAKNLIKDLP